MKTWKGFEGSIEHLKQIVRKSKPKATFEIASEFLKDSNYYAPKDTGDLIRSSLVHSDFDTGHIEWNTPYARRLFYNPQYNFSKDSNPFARGLWAEVAINENDGKYKMFVVQSINESKE